MRDVRRRVVTGPWPIRVALALVLSALVWWPFLVRTEPPPAGLLFGITFGVLGTVVGDVVQRRRDARDTGWTPTEQYDRVRRAYAGDAPADPADRSRLHRLVSRSARDQRHLHWFELAAFTGVAAVLLIWQDSFPGRTEWALAAYEAGLGATAFVVLRRQQRRRTALLEELRVSGVGRAGSDGR